VGERHPSLGEGVGQLFGPLAEFRGLVAAEFGEETFVDGPGTSGALNISFQAAEESSSNTMLTCVTLAITQRSSVAVE